MPSVNPNGRGLRAVRAVIAGVIGLAVFATAHATDLTVSAAASLTNAFNEIGKAFEVRNPGSKVQFNFAASGALLQQIVKGAPVDVFASADEETMDDAQKQDLVDTSTRVDFVRNSLVVIVPSDAKKIPVTLNDVAAGQKIAIGQPASVPVGRYTKSVLEQANLWSTIEPKMIGASSVRQALDYVARGEVDSGFVYSTDAAVMPDKVRVAFAVATQKPILYPIAALKNASDKALAQRFVRYVSSPESQAVLARYGFAKP
jgi:molybdate transport system substrate-binding protein